MAGPSGQPLRIFSKWCVPPPNALDDHRPPPRVPSQPRNAWHEEQTEAPTWDAKHAPTTNVAPTPVVNGFRSLAMSESSRRARPATAPAEHPPLSTAPSFGAIGVPGWSRKWRSCQELASSASPGSPLRVTSRSVDSTLQDRPCTAVVLSKSGGLRSPEVDRPHVSPLGSELAVRVDLQEQLPSRGG